MAKLKLAADLSLPVEVVTQTMAILAKRRAGKSYTMRRLAEQLFKSGQQVVESQGPSLVKASPELFS